MTSGFAGPHRESQLIWSAALWNHIHRSRTIKIERLERFRSTQIEHLTVHFLSGTNFSRLIFSHSYTYFILFSFAVLSRRCAAQANSKPRLKHLSTRGVCRTRTLTIIDLYTASISSAARFLATLWPPMPPSSSCREICSCCIDIRKAG